MDATATGLKRDDWFHLSRKLDWDYSYVSEREIFPETVSGSPWLSHSEWADWDEPFKTTFSEYVANQSEKESTVRAVKEVVGRIDDYRTISPTWTNALKLHFATLPLAEFAAVIGNLSAARFGRDGAWRNSSLLGALDELRHTQIPLKLTHELLRWDGQFDWTHRFYHTNNWIAIAARHFADELLLASNPIEFAIGTHFVFETGFTNLQFSGLTALARGAGDRMFEKMAASIQSDEARHSQIGHPVLKKLIAQDPEYAQYLLDKWFWRSWLLFAIVTGFSMDYFAPLEARSQSFKEFVEEWILEHYQSTLDRFGMKKPWYWVTFMESLDSYHHMAYASAYSYRSTLWFDCVVPGPAERRWLQKKYPRHWAAFDHVWTQVSERWAQADVGNDFAVHGTSIVGFCHLCQIVLCNGNPQRNSAVSLQRGQQRYIFCSEPCRWIFESEPARYAGHKDVVKRVLAGEAPGNVIALIEEYFGLSYDTWGKDVFGGAYPWLKRRPEMTT